MSNVILHPYPVIHPADPLIQALPKLVRVAYSQTLSLLPSLVSLFSKVWYSSAQLLVFPSRDISGRYKSACITVQHLDIDCWATATTRLEIIQEQCLRVTQWTTNNYIVDWSILFFLCSLLSEPDKITGVTPIMVAVQSEHTASIQELIARRVKLANKDKTGNTVFHYTVKCTNQHIIQVNFNMH
jgi:hypothetical protein